jgi:hypothetical protein
MPQNKTINVKGTEITIIKQGNADYDYISLTDMLKAKDGDFFISDWLRNRNTVEFLGIWERIYNPNFNYGEFAIIKSKAGLNNYKISVKEWVEKTKAIGLKAATGRYGGTYAHKDIAFEFGMWISAEFNYQDKDKHIAQHRQYTDRIKSFIKGYLENRKFLSYEIIDFLEDWILSHVTAEDKKYTKCFHSYGLY